MLFDAFFADVFVPSVLSTFCALTTMSCHHNKTSISSCVFTSWLLQQRSYWSSCLDSQHWCHCLACSMGNAQLQGTWLITAEFVDYKLLWFTLATRRRTRLTYTDIQCWHHHHFWTVTLCHEQVEGSGTEIFYHCPACLEQTSDTT